MIYQSIFKNTALKIDLSDYLLHFTNISIYTYFSYCSCSLNGGIKCL